MTPAELDELERITNAATAGPWFPVFTDDENSMNAVYVGTVDRGQNHDNQKGFARDSPRDDEIIAVTLHQLMPRIDHATELWEENAIFIAQARTAMPRLIAEIRRLSEDLAQYRSKFNQAQQEIHCLRAGNGAWLP